MMNILATERAVIEMIQEEKHLLATQKMTPRVKEWHEREVRALMLFQFQLGAERTMWAIGWTRSDRGWVRV